MKKLYYTFLSFLILALVTEVAILAVTKIVGWNPNLLGRPWAVSAHVHIFVLGALMFVILMILEKVFGIMGWKRFNVFYTIYLIGFTVTLFFILYKGFCQLFGAEPISALLQAGAAIGHTTLFVAFFFLAAGIRNKVLNREKQE